MNITVRELRNDTKSVLDAVEQGKAVVITRRGKPAARLLPIADNGAAKPKPLAGFGMWADRDDMQDVEAWLRDLRKPRDTLHKAPRREK